MPHALPMLPLSVDVMFVIMKKSVFFNALFFFLCHVNPLLAQSAPDPSVAGDISDVSSGGPSASEDVLGVSASDAASPERQAEPPAAQLLFLPSTRYRLDAEHHPMAAHIKTTHGTLCCDLFVDDHPLTVLNFKSLASGIPAWTDRQGRPHTTPYYDGLSFLKERGFVVSKAREEGTDFYVKDERCAEHRPVAGSLVMVQAHPGTASTRFMLLTRDFPEFYGMYAVFGHCADVGLIQKWRSEDVVIQQIEVRDHAVCEK